MGGQNLRHQSAGALRSDPDLSARAAARWHARYTIDANLAASESALLLAALTGLAGPRPDASAAALRALLEAHGRDDLAAVLPRF